MLSSSIFKKSLTAHRCSASSILKKLDELFGCVYLYNNCHPIIGFLPQFYCIQHTKQLHIYNRNTVFEYTRNTNFPSLEKLIQFPHLDHDKNLNTTLNVGFNGGYIGFIDYNFAAQQHVFSNVKNQPNLYLGLYLSYIKQEDDEWIFYSHENNALDIFNLVNQLINTDRSAETNLETEQFNLSTMCQARWSKQNYLNALFTVQEYIKAGDCYQINLTQEFTAKAQGLLLDTAEDFWNLTAAPYSGYLRVDDFELLSCSPELFIDFKSDRKIVTKPIKGTMPRYDDPILDEQSKNMLIHSKKDQAENVMIVDLLRNDLSVYAEIGSVKTPKLFEVESFNQVHHMVSEVTAILKKDINPLDVLLSALPGGSITGAPKIRAMEIIEELEDTPRGAYCGSLGYFNLDGTGSWNILIRSIQKYQDDLSIWAGGGITIASDAEAEYQECFDKVSAMLDLLNTWYKPE